MKDCCPLVSIVTPTRKDREHLVERCHQSVMDQDYPGEVEHVIVADQGSLLEAQGWAATPGVRLVTINASWKDGVRDKSVGAIPWLVGSFLAHGQWIGFLGDDDELLPDHVDRHVAAMSEYPADFSVSPVQFRVGGLDCFVIGDGSFAHGHLDAIGIMCRQSALSVATWTATGEDAADWRLVQDWLKGGLAGVYTGGQPTAIHNDGWAAR